MARMLSGLQVLRIAAEIGAIPASAEITPRALIIARDMGASRLVPMIEEKLHGSPVVLSNGD
jgi:hypothetical protein